MASPADQHQPLTVADVAEQFKISPRQAQRLALSGALAGKRVQGRWTFTEAQLTRYLEAHAYGPDGRVVPAGGRPIAYGENPHLIAAVRKCLGDGPWATRHLAAAIHASYDDAYQLVLAWHAKYLIDHVGRGRYRFAPPA